MVILNTIVGYLVNPLMLGILLLLSGCALQLASKKRLAIGVSVLSVAWFWVWGTHALYTVLGLGLERPYPPIRAEALAKADAIVVLGGGMGSSTNAHYAEMWSGADRVWHAARLYHAGKAPVIIPSGTGERESSVPLLKDFGVPEKAIFPETKARNTEENAFYVARRVQELSMGETNGVQKILLVTSAWHMRRALLNFRQTNLIVIPAATDHEAFVNCEQALNWRDFLPSVDRFYRNGIAFKEWLGYGLYKVKYAVFANISRTK